MKMNHFIEDITDTCDSVMEFSNGKDLYLSISMDVVDPAFSAAVARPEPGGFTSRQLIYLVQRFNKIKSLRAVDIVEANPEKNGGKETVNLAAKIVSEFL